MDVSFRCKVCGRLEAPSEGGEAAEPGLCRVCGSKAWERLWETQPGDLDPEFTIVEHIPADPEPQKREPQNRRPG